MKIESVIYRVNQLCYSNQYARARILILKEWTRMTDSKNFERLNSEAKQLLKIIKDEKENGTSEVLDQRAKKIIDLVNQCIRDLQLPYARKIYMEHQELFQLQESKQWLTSDARYICHAWDQSVEQ